MNTDVSRSTASERYRMLYACSTIALALTLAAIVAPPAARAEDPRSVPLIDQRGDAFRLSDLRGRSTLITFVASRCTDACPIANAAFSALSKRLRRDGIDARLVTITLDPDYDTPFVMAQVARPYAAAPRDWTFASGPATNVRRVMRSFGVAAEKHVTGAPDLHSSFVYILDRRVRLKRTLLLFNRPESRRRASNQRTDGGRRATSNSAIPSRTWRVQR